MNFSLWFCLDASLRDDLQCLLIIQMPDNVVLLYFVVEVPMCQIFLSLFFFFFFKLTTLFAVILHSFVHTHTHTHAATHAATHANTHKHSFVVANVGAPEEEITRTQHATCGSLHILFFFPLSFKNTHSCDAQEVTQHIKST